ncbi:DUF11 domain-containing protein [Conexibacter arvalis]|uniref:COG1361 S-layer family protein n=1 Tax=Conexibacter arvalis TaxID=912552 RepID=UPI00161A1F7C|nr:DUF11 domain-containing protein [Conexibacter arvalis]
MPAANAVAAPGTPGVPQAPIVAYDEPFENGVGTTPVLLTSYTSASGIGYTADPTWLRDCNGVVLSAAAPNGQQPASGCATALDYGNVRQMAYALGAHGRAANPSLNHAVSAMTEGNPGLDRVQFETTTPVPLAATGRFLTFSVDATETNCHANHALYKFYLVDGATAIPTFTRPIEPCADPRAVPVAVPAIDVSPGRSYLTGTFAADRAVLFSGSELGIRMLNGQQSGTGNDAAFDNIRVLDVTPQLDKSFSPTVLDFGQTSTLTFTITNTSELSSKEGWSFTDNLPAGLVVANPAGASTTCTNGSVTAAAGSGSIEVRGDLEAGQASCIVRVNVTSQAPGRFTNGPGNVTGTGVNPPAESTVHFRGADLSVVKSATSSPAIPGTNISYQLVVRNDGPDTAVNARVTDALPAGLTFVSATPGCSANGQDVTCAIGDLPAGNSRTFTVTASVGSALDAGMLENTATTTSDTSDPNRDNNRDTERVPVEPRADLEIVKRALSDRVVPGRQIAYELIVVNHGPSPARAVTVSDPLPRGLTFVSADSACRFAEGTVTCAVGEVASGSSVTYRVVTKVATSVTADSITNTATVDSTTRDPDPGNNRDTERVPSGPEADLSITKIPSVETVKVGGQLFYTLLVRNDGPSDAQRVVVTDAAGAGLTLLSAQSSQGGSCTVAASSVTCSLGTLAVGGSAQVLVSARADLVGELVNTARVESPTKDPDPRNNRDERRVPSEPGPLPEPADLEIVKSANRRSIVGSGLITYTLRVRNLGPGAATDVRVIDTPSLRLQVRSVRSSVGSCTKRAPVRCSLGTLRSGESATIRIVGRPLAAGVLRNSASVTGNEPDPNPRNNIDGTRTRVQGLLKLTKTASAKTVRAGGTVTYKLRVTNASGFALRSVRVCDRLPSGLVFVSSTPKAKLTKGQRCWTFRALGAKKSKTITLKARVLRGAGGRKVNVAKATAPNARGARSRAATGTAAIRVLPVAARGGGVTG